MGLMAKYYAWSNIPTEIDEWGITRKMVKTGEEVTQAKLGVEKEEWENLIEVGAVSEEEYPDIPDDVSPAEYAVTQAALEAAEQEVEELRLTVQPTPEPVVEADPAKAPSGTTK